MLDASKGELKRRHRLQHRAAGQHRLQPLPGVLHVRCDADGGGGWCAGPRHGLVRQRVGLLQPHVGHRRVVRQPVTHHVMAGLGPAIRRGTAPAVGGRPRASAMHARPSGLSHVLPHARQPGRRRQARSAARRPQRAGARRQDHRPDPHRAPDPHHPRTGRQGRQGHRLQPLRPPEGQAGAGDVAGARWPPRSARCSAGASASPRTASASRRSRRCERMARRRRAGAGEHPLPRRARRRTTRPSPPNSRSWPTSTSTTRSPPPTARTPAPRAWRTCCPPTPAA